MAKKKKSQKSEPARADGAHADYLAAAENVVATYERFASGESPTAPAACRLPKNPPQPLVELDAAIAHVRSHFFAPPEVSRDASVLASGKAALAKAKSALK